MKNKISLLFIFIFSLICTLSYAQTYPPLFGIQDPDMPWNPSLPPDAQEAGVKWVREFLFWDWIEPNEPVNGTPGYNWSTYDTIFLEYKNRGFEVIALIGGLPSWAAVNSYGPFYSGRIEDFKRFIRDLVERYDGDGINDAPGSPVVRFFEFFNEPDLINVALAWDGWGYWSTSGGGDGTAYAQMLCAVYPEVKGASSQAMVVFGGLAMEPTETGNFDFGFLDEVLNPVAGGGNCFDIMNFHSYKVMEPNWSSYGKDILGKTNYVKSKLSSKGLTKPIFITEAGHWSATDCTGLGGINGGIYLSSEELQAQYAMKIYARAKSDDVIKSVIWYVLRDKSSYGPCDGTRGLLRENDTEKPAYRVYQTASDLLGGATYQGPLSEVEEGYKFLKGGTNIYALWNDSGNQIVTLYLDYNHVIKMDKLGNQQILYPTSGNRYDLTVGPDPIYLTWENTIYVSKDDWCNGNNPCFPNIQNGIASASAPSVIKITQETYNENVVLDFDEEITLQGGWNTSFTSNSSFTIIQGSITITHGKMIIEWIIFE